MRIEGSIHWEGLAINKKLGIAIHHAWNVLEGNIVDATGMNPEDCYYMGIHIPTKKLIEVLTETKVYGVLDPGRLNVRFMFDIDSELEKILNDFMNKKMERDLSNHFMKEEKIEDQRVNP